MAKIKIASVSYLNSIPFTYGINESQLIDADLTLATPRECTELLRSGDVDIALIPVGALAELGRQTPIEVVTSHCIGTVGAVRSVVLVSDDDLPNIKRVWLDPDSQTSVKLMAHLADNYFMINPEWRVLDDMKRVSHPEDGDAFLLIGDKVFDYENEFDYSVDLGQAWCDFTAMPFAFAVWCCRVGTPLEHIEMLEESLTWGVERIYEALRALRSDVDIEEGYNYLTMNIDYEYDSMKRAALAHFLESKSTITITR